jgi:hypothetical protein
MNVFTVGFAKENCLLELPREQTEEPLIVSTFGVGNSDNQTDRIPVQGASDSS